MKHLLLFESFDYSRLDPDLQDIFNIVKDDQDLLCGMDETDATFWFTIKQLDDMSSERISELSSEVFNRIKSLDIHKNVAVRFEAFVGDYRFSGFLDDPLDISKYLKEKYMRRFKVMGDINIDNITFQISISKY